MSDHVPVFTPHAMQIYEVIMFFLHFVLQLMELQKARHICRQSVQTETNGGQYL